MNPQRVAQRWLTRIAARANPNLTYYHGTRSESAARDILAAGFIQPPEITERRKLTPVQGKVYLTSELSTAIMYALGGDIAGSTSLPQSFFKGRSLGFVFIIPGEVLANVQPDEDQVGELVYVASLSLADQQKYHGKWAGKVPSWILPLAQHLLTPRQWTRVLGGEYADWAAGGKKILKSLSDRQKQEIIDIGGVHVAHDGPVHPTECWSIETARVAEIKSDGSNFFEIATPYR